MGWNGSGEQKKVKGEGHGKKVKGEGQGQEGRGLFRFGRGALAGLIVVVGAGLAAWLIFGSGSDRPKEEKERNRVIKKAQPAKSAKQKEVKPPKERLPMPKPSGLRIEKREEIPAPQSLEEMEAAMTNRPPKRKAVFTNGVEQLIALATPRYPGAMVPPLPPITDESVAEDLKAAMSHKIAAEEGDSDAVLEKKVVVASAKIEFSELKESEGCGFVEYVNALRDKANDDANFLAEAQRLAEELYHDAAVSNQDYIKYREQLNEDLRARGLPEIEKEEGEDEAVEEQGKEEKAEAKERKESENE